ncbi:MAG TPA: hypothetical protein DCM14_04905 [Clostridiales bacterium UBA8153]|nr:hypothetical protein [Clostridiales bacterium UBA8153]
MDLREARAVYVNGLEAAVGIICRTLARLPEVRRVSLFGSYARGRRDLLTDLDILVILDTDEPFVTRLQRVHGLVCDVLRIPVDFDLLAYTPAEFEAMRGTGFLSTILEDEVVLYEKASG